VTEEEIVTSIASVKCRLLKKHPRIAVLDKRPCRTCLAYTRKRINVNEDIDTDLIYDTALIVANNYRDYVPNFLDLDFALRLLEDLAPAIKERVLNGIIKEE
jgi:hypothetical protein